MDKIFIARDILESFDGIHITNVIPAKKIIEFSLEEKEFVLFGPDENNPSSAPSIYIINAGNFDFPHVLFNETKIENNPDLPNGSYRYLCLRESGEIIQSLLSYEEKIMDIVSRLFSLLNLSPVEKEHEYQKEFLYYWNQASSEMFVKLYLGNLKNVSLLNVYTNGDQTRLVSKLVCLSDLESTKNGEKVWICDPDSSAIFIPLVDSRYILPPKKGYHWGISEISELLCGNKVSHITRETFLQLQNTKIKTNVIYFVFKMENRVTFVSRVSFKNAQEKPLLQKILDDTLSVQEILSIRCDYYYLNRVIGNDSLYSEKKVLLIGAGSLGGYIAAELVKNGFNNITVYDGDIITTENTMRYVNGGRFCGFNKATALKIYLEEMHPEINIQAYDKNIDQKSLLSQMGSCDLIIFAVGSSDTQLAMNRVLKNNHYGKNVLFIWLEAGGEYSHILKVNYQNNGCFECLYTSPSGELVNNKANIKNETEITNSTIHNGCGGTRVAYGTAVLMRTTAVLLDVLKNIEAHKMVGSGLVNISPVSVEYLGNSFIEKECLCCGCKTQQQMH